MQMSNKAIKHKLILFTFLFFTLTVSAFADGSHEFCSKDHNWSGKDKVSVNESRESIISPTSVLTVDGRKNGGIKIIGENRSDVLVRACVQAWAKSEGAAQSLVKLVRIETGSIIRASENDADHWSVSFEVRVPRATNLHLTANNGGVSIEDVNGNIEFETRNGGVKLDSVGGNVKGKTENGGVKINLSGNSWDGNGLDVETRNGGVKLTLPKNFAANIETGTVNGGFSSDFPELKVETNDKDNYRSLNKRINASINGGGATIRVVTTNGGVKIGSSEN